MVKKDINDKNDYNSVNEAESNLNFNFRNDNSGINKVNKDENKKYSCIYYNIDTNLPHFGDTNPMNSEIIINNSNSGNNFNRNSARINIFGLSSRELVSFVISFIVAFPFFIVSIIFFFNRALSIIIFCVSKI